MKRAARSTDERIETDTLQLMRLNRIAGIADVVEAHPRWFPDGQGAKDVKAAQADYDAAKKRLANAEHENELPVLMQAMVECGQLLAYRMAFEAMMKRRTELVAAHKK